MSLKKEIVLVVDDDRAVRESLKFALELDGLAIGICESAAELLNHPDLSRAACVVLDQKMPAMDGVTAMHELNVRGVAAPIILIASQVTDNLRQRARREGVFAVLEKPLLDNRLLENVHKATRSQKNMQPNNSRDSWD